MSTVVAWNIESYRGRAAADGLDHALEDADVAVLTEMLGNRAEIRDARKDYDFRPLITGHRGDMASTGLLVHRHVPIRREGLIRVWADWEGPKGGDHNGRGFPYALAELDEQWTWVVGVHMPWSADRNPEAVDACWDALERFAQRHPNLPIIFAGDWNASPDGDRAKQFAKRIGARIVRGHGVDYMIIRDGRRGRSYDVAADVGGNHGSDHPITRFRVTPRGRAH